MEDRTRHLAAAQLRGLAALFVAGTGWVLLALALAEPPLALPPWAAFFLGLVGIGGAIWIGWAVRQAWSFPRALRQAEQRWNAAAHPAEVVAALEPAALARGELGYRIGLLRAAAQFAGGGREAAWASYLQAELARLPFPVRWRVGRRFRPAPRPPLAEDLAAIAAAVRWAPNLAHLPHLQAVLRLQANGGQPEPAVLDALRSAVRLGAEQPILLEDLICIALRAGDLGLAGEALARLLARHQDPRLPWNRAAGMRVLLGLGRPAEAAALAASVPPGQRTDAEVWILEAAARRTLGDFDGADDVLGAGLERHPRDFGLWMESHALAMEDRAYEDAFADLEEAARHLDPEDREQRWAWALRRAEFAWWVDGDARDAMAHLATVPPEHQGDQVPPLRLTLRAALGEHAAVLEEVKRLSAQHPDNPDLELLHGECLAGLEAWEPLAEHLQRAREETRRRPACRHLLGRMHAANRRLAEAREEMEKAASLDPQNLRYVLDAGHACADLGEWERSEAHWQQALRIDPACPEALLELAEARLARHDRAAAVRYLRECLLHHPDAEEAQLRLAELEAH